MSLISKILRLSWRTSTLTTDPEQDPSRTTAIDPSLEPSVPENPTAISSPSPATSIPITPPSPMLTQAISAMNVGLRLSAFMTPPALARPVHSAIVERFHSRVRNFYQTGINIARFVLGSVIDLAPQRVEANGENGVNAPPQGTQNSSRRRWLWGTVSLVAVVGVMALATMLLLQNHSFYRELLEMRRIA